MSAPEYHFVTEWRLSETTIEEAASVLEDVEGLAGWWPSVYLRVRIDDPGGPGGMGKKVTLLTKGYLPYKLKWSFEVTESNWPHQSALVASGDFVGRGEWRLTQEGDVAVIVYDWRIQAGKPLLRRMTWLLRPVFSWNHRWAMEQGDRSLRAEVQRRRQPP